MSQAEELLNSVSESEIMLTLSNPETEPHIVIGDDRIIVVPDELKRLAVQYDHDAETVTFDCPRYWDEHDMSQMGIYINYRRKDRALGCYRAENIVVDDADPSIMHFDWTISRNVSLVVGKLQFLVCVKKMDEEGNEDVHWNSELCEDCYVSEGLETGEVLLEPYPDVISQWAEDVEEVKAILLEARDNGEFDGFSPNVTVVDLEDKSGYRVVITDRYGANTFDVMHGSAATATAVELEDGSGYRVVLTDAMDGAQIIELKHGSSATATAVELEDGSGYRVVLTDAVDGDQIIELKHGEDGVSPNVTVIPIEGGNRLVLTDASGANTIDIMDGIDGKDGTDGEDGFSPNITVVDIDGGHRVVLTDQNGANTIDIMDGVDGKDGADGEDGFSPNVTLVDIDGGTRVVITDASGANTFDVMDGATGATGAAGADGEDGFSPNITLVDIDGGTRVVATDANGANIFDVMDGADGFSPTVEITEIEGGHSVAITDVNGTQSFDVMDGDGNVATPDLSVNDETSAAYVANRTHYVADDGTVYPLDNQFLDLDWLPTIEWETKTHSTGTNSITFTAGDTYVTEFDGFTYEIFSGLSEVKISLLVNATDGGDNIMVTTTYPVVQQTYGYMVGNGYFVNSSYEDTGDAFCMYMSPFFGDNVLLETNVTGSGMFTFSYSSPIYNEIPTGFLPEEWKFETVTISGAQDDYNTLVSIYEVFKIGKAVCWENTSQSSNNTYKVLFISDASTNANNIYMFLVNRLGFYYYMYPSADLSYSYSQELFPLIARGQINLTVSTNPNETLWTIKADGKGSLTVTDSSTSEVKTLATTDDINAVVSIASVEQTTISDEDGGTNVVTVTLSDDTTTTFNVKNGNAGTDGEDGFSPNVTLVSIDNGTRVVITDAYGANTFDIMNGTDGVNGSDGTNGKDGVDGEDGFSPNVTLVSIDNGTRVVITDSSGANTFDIMNGTDGKDGIDGTNGKDGTDGVSPVVTVEEITGGHRVTITDVNGTQYFDVMDGSTDSIGEYMDSVTATDDEITEMLAEYFGS